MAAEVHAAVGPLVLEGRTLHPHGGFRFGQLLFCKGDASPSWTT